VRGTALCVDLTGQRAGTLVEAIVAAGIVATIAGATLGACAMASRAAGAGAAKAALQDALEGELTVARDVLKYQGATLAPATIATTLPLPAGTPLPAQLAVSTSALPGGGTLITIAGSTSGVRLTLNAALDAQAVPPGARLHAPGLAPAPTGAP
jgi:type II secretory pathway pseudopilin PulG